MTARLLVVEFAETENRPLGVRDEFLTGRYSESDVAHFFSQSAAEAAMDRAKNKRVGASIQIVGPLREQVRA